MKRPDFIIDEDTAHEMIESLRATCSNTGTERIPSFGNESSFLSACSHPAKRAETVLAIDVGGTRTKICIRRLSGSEFRWDSVLDLDNNDLKTEGDGKGLQRMTKELGRKIADACSLQSLPSDFDGVAVVWSNMLKCYPFPDSAGIRGVGARVFGTGQAYRKGEWWNSDIEDGDDISSAFLAGLRSAGLNFPVLIIGNDTIFVAKALPGADGGVVASTGANTTIVPLNSEILFNSECGAAIMVSEKILNLKKIPALIPGSNNPIKIEDLCAGKGLPLIFRLLISEAVQQGEHELMALSQALSSHNLSARNIGELVSGNTAVLFKEHPAINLGEETTARARQIAIQLIDIAGQFCGILIIISVLNQLGSANTASVALDSSQARLVPGYRQSLDSFLSAWNKESGKKVSYELLQPVNQISVPLRGAANSIDDFL